MEIGAGGLLKLSEMICGNDPFTFFPYRSSSFLTKFFLDFDYVHDGSTRSQWVNDVLRELNRKKPLAPNLPSKEIIQVIENLLHPDYFLFNEKVDRTKAIEAVRLCLKTYELTLAEQPNGQVKVCLLHGEFVSTDYLDVPTERLVTFKPSVFQIPNKPQNEKLISVMMPFDAAFNSTYDAIKRVADYMNLDCCRADSIWDNSVFIQDIFNIIYCSKIVVVDFTGRNPNVMYETGIAHTLGKTVLPITQSIDDIPSDLGHHRALKYLPNYQGYQDLSDALHNRLKNILEKAT